MSDRDDLDYLDHARMWRDFCRLMVVTVVSVIGALSLMAVFLL